MNHLADDCGCYVGELVTVGHSVILHAFTVKDKLLVGMGAIVLYGAVLGERSIIEAGALVNGGTIIPPDSLALGSPAKVVRTLGLDEQARIKSWAEKHVRGSRRHLARENPGIPRSCVSAFPRSFSFSRCWLDDSLPT